MMKTLHVSVLWLFVLVNFAFGQNLDISTTHETLPILQDEPSYNINNTSLPESDEEQQQQLQLPEKTVGDDGHQQLETSEKEDGGERDETEMSDAEGDSETSLTTTTTTTTTTTRPRSKPPDVGRTSPSDRGRRRPVAQRRVTNSLTNTSEIPLMSPERRNSYLSIAERRKYYNKTQTQHTKKPEVVETELENQETTNKVVTSSVLETLQTNEIPVSKKPTTGPKVLLTYQNSGKQKKFQNTRQSVIQSQFEFGQKLNSRKSTPDSRPQSESQEESKLPRNSENLNSEYPSENVTDSDSYPGHWTKLNQVNTNSSGTSWTATLVPEPNSEPNDLLLPNNSSYQVNLAEYVDVNGTRGPTNEFTNSVNSSAVAANDEVPESNSGQVKVLRSQALHLEPLSLSHENSSSPVARVKADESGGREEEANELANRIHSVYSQEILRLNSTRKSVRVPISLLKSFNRTRQRGGDVETGEKSDEGSVWPTTTTTVADLTSIADTPTGKPDVESTTIPLPYIITGGKVPSVIRAPAGGTSQASGATKDGYERTIAVDTTEGTTLPPTILPTDEIVNSGEKTEVNLSDATATDGGDTTEVTESLPKEPIEFTTMTPTTVTPKRRYPVVIQLNENNKRHFSEMFHILKPATVPTTSNRPTTSHPNSVEFTTRNGRPAVHRETTLKNVETTTPAALTTTVETSKPAATTPTTTTTTTVADAVSENVISIDDFQEEDRKAMGTRYNTKFYISPNVSRTQQKVIKVVEKEEEDDDEDGDNGVALVTRPVSVVVYVLAALGIVPLLLATVFASKFLIQRYQRRYDCESDEKLGSISTGECQMRQGKKKNATDLKKTPSNVTTTTLVTASRLPRVQQHWESFDKLGNSKSWEFPRSKLKMKTILGQGNFGQVWKAEVDDSNGHEGKTRLVAVKTVKEGATEKEHKEFIKELEIMQQIGSHPNIVALLGCCTDQEPNYLIMEYVKYGKLLTYLREHRVNENYYNFSSNADALTSKDLTVFSYCISRGMEYLVSRGIIHRDLAARNVLVDHNKVCKIADFGMSRSVRNFEDGQVYEERQHKGALPIRWMAPESLVYSVFTHKSDVWSFGIVMWEIVTLGSTPYPNMGAREIMRRVRDGYRLERPSHCKPEFYRLMSHCWCHDPNKRPDFSELRQDLSNLLEDPARNGSYVDLDRFTADNVVHMPPNKSNDLKLMERPDFRPMKRLGNWETEDWPEDIKRNKMRRARNNGKGTVTLTGQGSFTVNSRILEKEFKLK